MSRWPEHDADAFAVRRRRLHRLVRSYALLSQAESLRQSTEP